ncbi:hypothetical protein AOC36_09715 [Erysipelothrix larvae]|uniref:Tyr recombinase domain-containing protein n=1 Tax=Erysipelothrix larvae TaxID=1514105 RepID=A0A0X8H1E7_9FIRM|nr:site-specific integrase [Erysipelothrix larvae]AMC94250.1 hypothetical protein AOC36_09715 [Erysipelothrix larvae]
MAVYEDKKRGTWYFDIQYRDSTGKGKSLKRRGFKTEGIAERAERKMLRDIKKEDLPKSTRSMRDIGLEMIEEKSVDILPETKDQRIQQINDYMPDKPIGGITSAKAVKWRNDLDELKLQNGKPLSVTYKNRMIHMFKAIIKYAIAYDYIQIDPTLRMNLYKKTSRDNLNYNVPAPETFFEAYHKLKEKTPNNVWFKMTVLIAYTCGLSRAEIKGLSGKHFNNKQLRIIDTISGKDKRDRNKKGPTKRPSRNRTVNVDTYTNDELLRLKEILVKWELYDDDKLLIGYDSAFPNNTIQNNFKGMNLGCRFHDLRHAHTTYLIENGVPINLVAKRLGHASVVTTLNVYTHAMSDTEEEALKVLEEIVSKNL